MDDSGVDPKEQNRKGFVPVRWQFDCPTMGDDRSALFVSLVTFGFVKIPLPIRCWF